MDIGFIGLGRMGFQMARRLVEAKHRLIVHDTNAEAVKRLTVLGAEAASSPREVADRAETVMASLPSLETSSNSDPRESKRLQDGGINSAWPKGCSSRSFFS